MLGQSLEWDFICSVVLEMQEGQNNDPPLLGFVEQRFEMGSEKLTVQAK